MALFRRGGGARGPARARLAAGPALEVGSELLERARVDLALELDDRLGRHPVVAPAPGVELGLGGVAQAHVAVAPDEAQQVPDLLLAAVIAAPFAPYPLVRHFVAQPVAGAAQDVHVALLQADLLLQLAEHRRLGRLAVLDAALGKLPGVLVHALSPENLIAAVT